MSALRLDAMAVLCVLAACGPSVHKNNGDGGAGGDGGGGPTVDAPPLPHTLEAIVVTPTSSIIQLDLNQGSSQVFTATAEYEDGSNVDVSSQVAWTVANPAVGAMTGDTLAIPGFGSADAETSTITATLPASGSDAMMTGQGQLTVVAYRQSGAQQDFFFILPYEDGSGAQDKPLDFSTAIPALDVFFDMDTTGSMAGEIKNLQTSLNGTVIPGIQAAVSNAQFGVGAMEDFPISPYGDTNCPTNGVNDQPFKLMQTITSSSTAVTAGVNALSTASGGPIGCGNDTPEGGLESIYQAATGDGLTSPSPTSVPANHTGIGGVGFRAGTMPVIVAISDADSHGVGETGACDGQAEAYAGTVATVAHSRAQTKTALANICARVVGLSAVFSGEDATCDATAYMTDLATTTGARVPPAAWDVGTRPAGCSATQCCTGPLGAGVAPDAQGLCPEVFQVSTTGTGVSASLVTGIQMLTRFATFVVNSVTNGVMTDIAGNPLPAGHTTADFIKQVIPVSFTLPPPPPALPNPTIDTTNNAFDNVTPGTEVTFSVNAFNDFVPQTANAQIFRATIQVVAGGCTSLDQRDVLILVPPQPIQIDARGR
jgi:hypothetical protein|nr:hypothetical protein [Kofleriaceae bacterium]